MALFSSWDVFAMDMEVTPLHSHPPPRKGHLSVKQNLPFSVIFAWKAPLSDGKEPHSPALRVPSLGTSVTVSKLNEEAYVKSIVVPPFSQFCFLQFQ